MKRIASFCINHDTLTEGMYTSRVDGDVVTYDIRMVKPNHGVYLDPPAAHTFEHLFATYVRNTKYSDEVVYVGPMGCRTGCYIVLFGNLTAEDVLPTVIEMCDFVIGFEGEIPGARPEQCGNYLEQNLSLAKFYVRKYKNDLKEHARFVYSD